MHRTVTTTLRTLPRLRFDRPGLRLLVVLLVVLACQAFRASTALGANPPASQLYYVALPDDDLLTLFDADDEQNGTWPDASSPLRSVTSIAIAQTGTLVYYDQWEDGSYDGDIANPGGNTYDAGSNPDGTQIWGDGILTNGCPPSINAAINPCTLSTHDQLSAGQIIVLDNDVTIGSDFQVYDQFNVVSYGNNNGTANWLNSWTEVGDDAAAATGDVLITSNQLRFSQTEVADSLTRGVDLSGEYKATLKFTIGGTNLETDGSDDLRVQYSTDGTTYTTLTTIVGASTQTAQEVDLSGISGANTRIRFDSLDALEAGEFYTIDDVEVTWGFARDSSLIYFDGRDKVGVTSPVAMSRAAFPITPGSVMAGAAEVLDTSQWGTLFVAPVGEDTPDTNTSTFEDVRWFVMAQAGGATIDVDANGDGDLVDANDLNDLVLTEGGRRIVDGIQEGATLTVVAGSPVQVHNMMADVGDTFEFRWDALIPRNQWTGDYYSPVGTQPDGANGNRGCTEVWIYNPATGTSGNYQDQFASQAYNLTTGSLSWAGNSWTEENDDGSATAGTIYINSGSAHLRLRENSVANDAIRRQANLSGYTTATLSFAIDGNSIDSTDDISVEISSNGGSSYTELERFNGDPGAVTRSYDISAYIATNTVVRFIIRDPLETGTGDGDYWQIDNVNIAVSSGDITVNIDRPGGANPDATLTIPAGATDEWPSAATDLYDEGFHLYTSDDSPFLPVQIVDCTKDTSGTDGRLFDWGAPLVPANQLTEEVVVGFAPGCSNESFSGICHDPDSTVDGSTPDQTSENSRSVIWVTPLADTTIYVDTNGSGITCPGGAGAEQTQVATALTGYRFDDDPSSRNYVHDLFSTQAYNRDDIVDGWDGTGGRTTPNAIVWTSDWTETGETTSASAGAIQVNTTESALRLQELAATDETGRTVQRTHNTSGNSFARLSFKLESATGLDATDRIALDVSGDGGTNWTTLETFVGPYTPDTWPPTTEVYNISSYIATNTSIRFRFVDALETGDYWQIDDVHIDYVNGGDYDMTGSRIKTCNGALIAVAYGQDPNLTGTNDEEALDFGTLVPPFRDIPLVFGSIGDYVWVDEDGDGDQDAGEVGIPNVKVTLTGTSTDGTVYNLTTYTDANGGYVFTGLKPSNVSGYTVTVDSTTLPAGLAANPTFDENGIATPHVTSVVLASGSEHTTADFGYNWATTTATNSGGAGTTGAIGDRVWIDTDGDGDQDTNEIGINGVSVELVTAGTDGIFGTADDVVAATTSTDQFGNYIFDGLTAGAYIVRIPTTPSGYLQTGDPDETIDNKTTSPIVLGPGDVYLNADFGYQPSGASGSIGDLVWLDSTRNDAKDVGEPGIPGVTVSLIRDLDGDGVWDAGEPIIATDITDESGIYGFTGLPIADGTGTDDYLVWVNDTNRALDDLAAVYDVRDGGSQGNPATGVVTGLEISAVTNLTSTAVTDADFAYAPSGHDTGEGLIGDTVFYDRDADGLFDPGEGIEGVTVDLLDNNGLLVATTVTNENGQYFFGGLAAGTYTVQVATSTLPGSGIGLTNTVDPDGGTASQSSVTIAAGGVNLVQDFGYRDTSTPNTIGGTLWTDTDADGVLDGGEADRFAGVSVVLYIDSNGNGVLDGADDAIAATSTDSGGNYSFTNLPDGTFFVDVTDDTNVLNGTWHSLGNQSQAVDNNSKTDAFLVTVAGGQTVTTVDFGYYDEPAAIGDYVWKDLDGDGIQDAGETGIPGVVVILTITWPNSGGTTTLMTVTDGAGYYSFDNLLLDEDLDGAGAGEPTFVVSVATAPNGYAATLANQGGNDAVDSDDPAGVTAAVIEGTTDNTYDFGYVPAATIGNSVWLDENGDGRQDAGEAGIPNVTVELWNSGHTTLLATRVTDANGQYLFTNVPPGTYQVDVLNASLPAGLVQTTIPAGGGDFVNHADPFTTVTVTAGGENLTADFGYNWAPSADTDGNINTGAIGDRVWVDTDGDGKQDAGEIGIAGVTVELRTAGADGLFDTGDDVTAASTVTGSSGDYIFDGLAAGAYVVRIPTAPAGYTQTGDPDHFGVAAGTNDNKTTAPIVLGPGDVFLNADFGYQPTAGTFGSIGDFVWLDSDADGVQDVGEPGLLGVTVALIKDSDGDGVWDAGEPIIATTMTSIAGSYNFGGLPVTDGAGTDDYLVWVNDTDNVLGALDPTFDRDGLTAPATGLVTGASIAAVSNLAPAGVTDADFGYTADGHRNGQGLIGDTIFIDRDADNALDAGEGVEGVVVELYDSTGTTLLASTTTDENGNYWFGGLTVSPGGVTYQVRVASSNFSTAAVLQGLANTVDPDGGTASQSQVTITTAAPTNLAQDFGYRATTDAGSIGNLVWTDSDADGVKDASEAGLSGVTVDLYRDLDGDGVLDPGEPRVGTTTTAGDGSYTFSNLSTADNALGAAGADYIVDVSDRSGVLDGYWHSLGTAGANDNSQADPYAASISAGSPNNLTADFGYYLTPGAVGNFAFEDLDGDGQQDGGEPGIPGVVVTMTITWPNAAVTTLKTTTDITGRYSFDNLLQDEDYDGAGGGEPTFALSFSAPAGFTTTVANTGGDLTDSDWNGTTPVTATPVKGSTNTALTNLTDAYASYDAGFVRAGSIGDFVWVDTDRDGLQDGGEPGIPNVTLNLYRDDGDNVYEPGTGDTLVATTYTDGDGAYLFDGLGAGTYWVGVNTATVPSGYVAQYDEDDGTTAPDDYTIVTLAAAADHLTADFGYGPADTGDSSSLGDRVWYDADGDGEQDDGEVGIGGVTITITPPGGVDIGAGPGNPVTVTTASDGSWLKPGLPAGNYTVAVTPPAGYNATPTNGAVSRVIQVPANTAVLYADFGFDGGTVGSIGNTIWLDADRDGNGPLINGEQQGAGGADNTELPIAGVSVSLIDDENNDGIWDPDGVNNIAGDGDDERIIATDVTDANGQYQFVGLSVTDGTGTDDYLVLVGDRDNLLANMVGTYDPDGAAGGGGSLQSNSVLGLSRVQDLTTTAVTNQDFGFAPTGGAIGNLVWHDVNNNGKYGVPVIDGKADFNGDGVVNTSDDGSYGAANIIDGQVDLDRNGVINSADDGYLDGRSVIDGQIDYDGGGTVTAADDGLLSEPTLQGVVMELWYDANNSGTVDGGDTLLRSTTTDSAGQYLFDGLLTDNVNYLVRPATTNPVLTGYTKTSGTAGQDNNSQAVPYAVQLTSAVPTNLTADFGYRATAPFTLSGTTFRDVNNNGGTVATYETGTDEILSFVPVFLYDDLNGDGILDVGEPLIASQLSDADGFYRFTDLPNGAYIVSTEAMQGFPNGWFQTTQQTTAAVEPAVISGGNVTDQDFGFFDPGGAQTTPVTISFFQTLRSATGVRFEWSTTTETGNIGFNLYERVAKGWRRVNPQLVPSHATDSLAPQDYVYEAAGVTGSEFLIQDVDVQAKRRQHGPFEAERTYGQRVDAAPIDWPAIQAEDGRMATEREAQALADTLPRIAAAVALGPDTPAEAAAAAAVEGEPVDEAAAEPAELAPDAAAPGAVAAPLAQLTVTKDGLYRVTYEQLLAAGFDLRGVASGKLALVNRGQPVAVRVEPASKAFGPGSTIDFYGEAATGAYTRSNVYHLWADSKKRKTIGVFKPARWDTSRPASSYLETVTVDNNRAYGTTSSNGDPWYNQRMLVYTSPGTWSFPLTVDNLMPGAAELTVKTWGGTDWEQSPDHHMQVAFNDLTVQDVRFDGLTAYDVQAVVPDGGLREGSNTLKVTLPGDTGLDYDLVNLDSYTLRYQRGFEARDGSLAFRSAAQSFRVTGLPNANVMVFRQEAGKLPQLYSKVTVTPGANGTFTAEFAGGPPASYVVSALSALGTPGIAAVRPLADLSGTATDYVIITHPNFAAGVDPLISHHQARGLRVKKVDVLDVYDQYGHGLFDPQAIKAYVAALKQQGVRYVLLVGGDTYDYLNYLGQGAISFIPSLYAETDPIVRFAPVDPQYADVDNDGVPDLALGRLPVRTNAELDALVGKVLAYANKSYGKTAVFAADEDDPLVPFTADSELFISQLPSGWSVERAHVGQVGVGAARAKLLGELNEGVALTSFVGHSGPTAWTFSGLFRATDAASLTNAGKPTVVTQWGCWNTYFVSPSYNTLGHTFLLSGDRGAAAVLGASTLTLASSEEKLGRLVLPRLVAPGTKIGDAVLAAKQELARTDPGLVDVLLGWTLLGDPAQVVQP